MEENLRNGIVITVFSTASAVGKTLLSINMAAELARAGHKVCVADLDLQFGDVCNFLHLSPERTLYDAQQSAVQGVDSFAHCLTQYVYGDTAFTVLAAPLHLEEAYNISPQAVGAVLAGLRREYDYLILDTAAAFSELNLAVMDLSTIITFVGIVDFIPTIKNMKIGYDTMLSIGYDKSKIRFILNRSASKTAIELQDVELLLEERFYHVLPNQFTAATESIHNGIPLTLSGEETVLGRGLRELVAKYTNRLQVEADRNDPSLSTWFKQWFK